MIQTDPHPAQSAYIELIKRAITNYHYLGGDVALADFRALDLYDAKRGEWRIAAEARPLTLLTKGQLDLIEELARQVIGQAVAGDFIEAGVWRGGAIVLLRALLKVSGIADRRVFAADSFAGIPLNVSFRHDPVDKWSDRWVASRGEVEQGIARFGLLDPQVVFVEGFFAESLKALAGERFALIRLDSDSYESVLTSLEFLYPLLSPGGALIIDDWHLVGCQMAVGHYRTRHGITERIETTAGNAWWIKQHDYGFPHLPG